MDLGLAPSYKAICIAVLKNDHSMQSLGYSPKKSKYYSILKQIELKKRNEKIQ
jgi:predicted phosphoadenosine phosphosulfate sulfurtransferase